MTKEGGSGRQEKDAQDDKKGAPGEREASSRGHNICHSERSEESVSDAKQRSFA